MKNAKFTEVQVGKYTMQQGEKAQFAKNPRAFCVADSKVIVYGHLDGLKAVLERNKKPELGGLQAALKETDLSKPVAFAADLKAIMAKTNKGNRPAQDPFSQGLGMAEGLAGHATLGKSDSLTVTVLCKDTTAANDLRKMIEGGVVMVKQMPNLPKEATDALGSLKVTTSGGKVSATSDLKVLSPALVLITLLGQRANSTFEKVGNELGK
jgi:hypothetical protein